MSLSPVTLFVLAFAFWALRDTGRWVAKLVAKRHHAAEIVAYAGTGYALHLDPVEVKYNGRWWAAWLVMVGVAVYGLWRLTEAGNLVPWHLVELILNPLWPVPAELWQSITPHALLLGWWWATLRLGYSLYRRPAALVCVSPPAQDRRPNPAPPAPAKRGLRVVK